MKKEIAIKTAAKWWTDRLRERGPHSNGDNSMASMLANMFADMASKEIPEDKLQQFQTELELRIEEFMAELSPYAREQAWLCCDYGPGIMLRDAADAAGIDYINFPFKTNVVVEKDGNDYRVRASHGYAQPYVAVLPEEATDEVGPGDAERSAING